MPPIHFDWPEVQRVAAAFRLAMPRSPVGGRLGERLGSGTGSSLEFQDYRQYTLGDDLRHVDWSAYARSEVLAVRLYREEVAPRIDLVLDVSRSMTVTEDAYPPALPSVRVAFLPSLLPLLSFTLSSIGLAVTAERRS